MSEDKSFFVNRSHFFTKNKLSKKRFEREIIPWQKFCLLTDKKALHIQARGGIYSEGPAAGMEMGHRYLAIVMQFFGVLSFEGLFIEGHAAMPDKAQEIKENAIARAKDLAHTF